MNERIRELAQEAEAYADYYAIIADELEKDIFVRRFAQLIVRECVTICNSVQEQYGQYTFTATTVKNRIQEHFGVAE